MRAQGLACSLSTGQELVEVAGAQHTSCTVEMAELGRRVEVAVIDEFQMVGSSDRGAGWTRALLGLPANEIHVCGDASMVRIVQDMCSVTGDAFELKTYKRLSPLKFGTPLKSLAEVQRCE
jgi:ATP-dependent RNA helicase SUPV3L1/SUV3